MITYIVKSSLGLVVLFGLYWFLLRKEKLFVFNRYFLILAMLFSLATPLIPIPVNLKTVHRPVTLVSDRESAYAIFPAENTTAESVSAQIAKSDFTLKPSVILLTIYIAGAVIFLFRFSVNIIIIKRKVRSSGKASYKGYELVLTDDKINPCCFFNRIYLNRDEYLEGKIDDQLLDHELEHARQAHTADIILLELVKSFYWFNPVHILYDRAIRINHEYLADNEVIRQRSDINEYAEKLLGFISARISVSLTSASDNSFTRNRLAMMLKSGSGKMAYATRIAMTTLLGTIVLISTLGFKEVNNKDRFQDTGSVMQNSVRGTVTTVDGTPMFGAYVRTTVGDNQSLETIADYDGHFQIDDVMNGALLTVGCSGFRTETVKPDFSSVMTVKLERDPEFKGNPSLTLVKNAVFMNPDFSAAKAIVVIDGKVSDLKVNPADIRNIDILTGDDATGKYGKKAKDGVVEITTFGARSKSRYGSIAPDSSKYLTLISVNHGSNKGEVIDFKGSDLYSVSMWTYHFLDKTDKKELRSIGITTRDSFTAQGTVTGENNRPLPGVKITVTGSDKAETTDKDGRFKIKDVREDGMLEFSMPGYETYYLNTNFRGSHTTELAIELEKETKQH